MISLELLTAVVLALIALVLVATYRYLLIPYDFFEKRTVPGPEPRPIFGTWGGLWNKVQGEEDVKRVSTYGSIYGEYAGRTPVLVTAEPSVVRAILHDHIPHFTSRRANCVRDKFLQQGLLALETVTTRNGPEVPLLSKENIQKVMPRIHNCTTYLNNQITKAAEATEGKIIISDLITEFLGKVLVEAVLGQDESGEKIIDQKQFTKYLKQVFLNDNPDSPLAAIPFIYPSLAPLDKFIMKPKAAKYFTILLLNKINERAKEEKKDQDHLPDLLDVLLQIPLASKSKPADEEESKAEENVLQTKEFTFAQSLAVFLNTSLVTKQLLSAGVAMLGAKPEIQERLHAELYQRMDASDSYDLVNNSEFLDAFVAEVLRLYPVEYRVERQCCESIQLERVKLEKGLIVSIPVYALHRQTVYYPEPDTFNPERFSRENKEKLESSAFVPYGQAGDKAANISIQWSVLVGKLALASLVKHFKFVPGEDTVIPPAFEKGVTGIPRLQPFTILAEVRK